MKKPAITEVKIDELIASRWSPRAFNPEFLMNDVLVKALFEAARWAPSCYGDQPWKYILFNKQDATAFSAALNCLSVGNQDWAMDASILILVCANKNFNHNGEPNRFHQYDTGAASENICLQASSMNLSAHQMGGFDIKKAKALADVPDEFEILSFIAVGSILERSKMNESQEEREVAGRKRKPLEEVYNINTWKK
jgi:nitroreductase